MEDLRKFVKRTIRIVILLPLIWFGFVIVWGSLVPERFRKNLIYSPAQGFMDLRIQEADHVKDIDLLIVGSSHMYRGIDPRTFAENGINTFNFGSSLQTPLQTEYLLKKYIDKMQPALVLLEVGYKTFSSDGVEGAMDIIINSNGLNWRMLEMAMKVNDISVYNTLAYTFFRKNILGETRQEYLANIDAVDRYVAGGFVEREDPTYIGPESFEKTTKLLCKDQQRALERCLALLSQRGIKTILIQTPILQDYYSSIQNMNEFNDYFTSLSDRFMFYNFNTSIYEGTHYFYDHHHLNSHGVTQFNNDLVEVIRPHLKNLRRNY